MAGLCRLRATAKPVVSRFFGVVSGRGYGSAAAQLVDDYDYDCEDYESDRHRTMEDSEGSFPRRGVQWVIMGDPLAKKHVYAERLSKLLKVPHISMGTLVRQELNPRSTLYKQIASAVNGGKLVPEEIVFGLLSRRLEEGLERGESGFILDGIPRSKIQAEILDQIADIDLVVNFKCTKECLSKQQAINGRYSSGEGLLSLSKPGFNQSLQSQGNVASFGAENEVMWTEKLQSYAEQSKPLEDYYRKQKKLLDFEVAGAPGETWPGLLAALHLQHMNVISSSQKLTA